MAAALGRRIQQEGGSSDTHRIRFAWQVCLARSPSDAEVARLAEYLNQERQRTSTNMPLLDESPVWKNFASVLLNLHEFITRD
jgi:hypothetical protein